MQVVWFKKDLRIADHAPLFQACKAGPCLCLFVYEPELIGSEEFDGSHLDFLNQSLKGLDQQLRNRGGSLVTRFGEVTQVLSEINERHSIEALWSHEETGNSLTYERDKRVLAWTKERHIPWNESPQSGVVRRLKNRDGWSAQRNQFMAKPLTPIPERIPCVKDVDTIGLRGHQDLGLRESRKTNLILGGEVAANELLNSFLHDRGQYYSKEMSSPTTAYDSCSRLSASITWGCLSVRQIVQALRDRQVELREEKKSGKLTKGWLTSMRSFDARLSWHCHFMQKLEDEPRIEFQNMSRVYDGLREDDFSVERFELWCEGKTGYPLVDACMRALKEHSWINFRMRAMLVSFSSYHLWLHWRKSAVFLAKHFLDFEPGIHFSQVQMQSGTTGINTVRIYSPIKQVKDQDPDGVFIKRYVPELAGVPKEHLAEPHQMSLAEQSKTGCIIGKDYPSPIVEHLTAYRSARDRIYAIRKQDVAREEARRVVKKHGSRKNGNRKNGNRKNDV